jgi:flagellar biosynthesis/type III secretory pathway chaperone
MVSNSDKPLSDLLAELRHILEEERRILLSGRPEQLAGVIARKLSLAERIETADAAPQAIPSPEALVWLATYNRGNSVICSALLRQLTRTMDALRRRELHRSYGPDGTEASPAPQNRLVAA